MTKEERLNIAKKQYKQYEEIFADIIASSVNGSIVYRDNFPYIEELSVARCLDDYNIEFDDYTTNNSIYNHCTPKTAVLNFASFRSPGGGFLNGAIAQEEALCTGSTLYNVISKFQSEYEFNKKIQDSTLYKNFAIYSPNIIFTEKKPYKACDVITCAAPNIGAYNKMLSQKEQYDIMKERIKFILDICHINNVNTIILGAFGCGVFKNDPYIVSAVFRDVLKYNNYSFKKVIFSIPDIKKLNIFSNVILEK